MKASGELCGKESRASRTEGERVVTKLDRVGWIMDRAAEAELDVPPRDTKVWPASRVR
jgi:hypothetical protein